jgi:hypothetical protein
MEVKYPHNVNCYLLVARDGLPPHPEDEPVEIVVVKSPEEDARVRKQLSDQYPNSWLIDTPL